MVIVQVNHVGVLCKDSFLMASPKGSDTQRLKWDPGACSFNSPPGDIHQQPYLETHCLQEWPLSQDRVTTWTTWLETDTRGHWRSYCDVQPTILDLSYISDSLPFAKSNIPPFLVFPFLWGLSGKCLQTGSHQWWSEVRKQAKGSIHRVIRKRLWLLMATQIYM